MVRFAVGGFLLMLGFASYQVGSHIGVKGEGVLGEVLGRIMPQSISVEIFSLTLQFGGGLLAIIGFLLCISSLSKPTIRVEEVKTVGEETFQTLHCKFCGGQLEGDSAFCPICGRSQV
ncbi:MAG: hypothetical protein ACUVTM_00275 [Candidatus Bathyarchaeia archaeon]